MTALPEGFIAHDGGPCPVHPHSKPAIIIRGFNRWHLCQMENGPEADEAGQFEWLHNPSAHAADIIAYRIKEPDHDAD